VTGEIFLEPLCDWLSFRHDYPALRPGPVLESGRVLRIDRDGVIEWESATWDQVRCMSSDTSVRVKCDGKALHFSGNPGRFGEADNITGVSVGDAFDRAVAIIKAVFPHLHLSGVGSVFREGFAGEYGTRLTRIDLAGNFETDSYSSLVSVLSSRKIAQRLPQPGKFGPTWGYGTKRSQWHKAKLYDKLAEVEGRRTIASGATLARFEVQLGSEYLRQNGLSRLRDWRGDMGKIVYGKFAGQVFREQVSVENWSEIPPRLRQHAIMWRDGVPVQSYTSQRTYYRVRSQLMKFGIDISVPCNVIALTRQVRVVGVRQVEGLRQVAA
jgi:hypothetical protein